jgi:hypothetical protein
MSDWTICITPMPTEEALDIAARIADAEEPNCDDLLLTEGARVCDVLRCEVLHQAEVIERRTAELSTATGENVCLRAALAVATRSLEAATTGERLTTCDELARLSREVATVTRERDEAREIITGRKVPPTRAEIEVHALWNRRWLLRVDHEGRRLVYTLDAGREDALAEARAGARDGVRWWALECDGRPCAWPVVEVPHG